MPGRCAAARGDDGLGLLHIRKPLVSGSATRDYDFGTTTAASTRRGRGAQWRDQQGRDGPEPTRLRHGGLRGRRVLWPLPDEVAGPDEDTSELVSCLPRPVT